MKDSMIRIQEQFGFQEPPHALFHECDRALRFELGGEEFGMDRPILRFVQAHERARAVAQTFFRASSEIFVLFSSYGLEEPNKKRLKSMKPSGIKRRETKYLCGIPQKDEAHMAEFGDDLYRHWDVAKLEGKNSISEILWLTIASEMPIEPRI